MKTVEEIIEQQPVFLHHWIDKESVLRDFDGKRGENDSEVEVDRDVNILFASYGYELYSGNAFVLFEKDGVLFEVCGSHCSCYGLEGQWEPEEVVLKELENRLVKGFLGEDSYSGNNFKRELCEFLDVEFKLNDN
ncbi:hypothetical protein [Bacillus subtilis]|uniref:hypothetical protein n=1 Tax=Bacillus subtilis TaxID=1423 RepID=UPI002DB73779|nr:hypothetical protein [Bacillus subtilis]MEC2335172.1 hypothetical protein [Bacillus subtilis]